MARKTRDLSEDDRTLWDKVRASATPLRPTAVKAPDHAPPPPGGKPKPARTTPAKKTVSGKPANGAVITPNARRAAPLRMDKKTFDRLSRGKMKPDARIDLHGMTQTEAHHELNDFILTAHARGHRLALVITGKGRVNYDEGPIPVRTGILRHNVPQWLKMAPLSRVVLQIAEAHPRHGGSGALYVYLSRHG